jgi:hypothetical protein
LSSKIWRMSSNGQSGRQPSGKPLSNEQPSDGQSNQNPQNKLSHTSFGTYPPRPLSSPPLTMHKWGAIEMSSEESTSSTQTQKCQKLEDNDLKQIATHDFRKLSWHFLWNT